MIAGLPMYDRPETAAANDRLWDLARSALQDCGIAAPDALARDIALWDLWLRDDLVLAQTCGLPYRWKLHDQVNLVGTPMHALDCPAGHYYSTIVAREDDPRADFSGATPAVNEARSQSGWSALLDWAEATGTTLAAPTLTGAHVYSAKAVAEARADLAAIDAVTWRMIRRWEPWARTLREVTHTSPTPALPYICARGVDAEVVYGAIEQAIIAMAEDDRALLGLTGITRLARSAYLDMPVPDPPNE
ncbi:ABC-type phosphate/phosphonate transport system, periplasmic component [Candidatus Rhodobacter oscarellae]|uniref:ABC-type phosphate/phosphonate transport system, periplasmic component n=1 Tax=Candidatus Rhodobacter oscarellae TaxID=1675527 RepID=A0A0J9EDF9_9RHOB|nr:PhnD/SsuA/transferrin family substrate-binding protein [Candidatus Rhodobacter lobularis]KMW60745.1 ABC-type phosphate/phosphonate transport system, periplasmic component [Candidatus Rhodobacter lobularis]